MNAHHDLSQLSDEELLQIRICSLPLKIEGTWLEDCVSELYRELAMRDIQFRPLCYLADEWLTPDHEPVIGIPFFLADPALIRLEKKMMLEAEGSNREWCMKLLRHEAGHAINYAYRLYRRAKWSRVFGPFSREYTDTYRFRPYSRSFVRHLENYYAQNHPDDDFAETFAVWLTPHLDWRKQYAGWNALKKLEYVDELMNEIKDKSPMVKRGKRYWHLASLKKTLKTYYRQKRWDYSEDFPDFHDSNLIKMFSLSVQGEKELLSATDVIQRYRRAILNNVSMWTGEKKYVIGDLLKKIALRCRELGLVVTDSESSAVLKISTYITALTMNYLYTGQFSSEK
ncbi:MAG: hypothetical protein JW844_00595 [Candidatus Omnitrophica bacterium]|nr:hypothetical protein [Candidatus Omnitrophota bacterium]